MKTISKISAALSLSFSLFTGIAHAQSNGATTQRGAVAVAGPNTKAVVVGPMTIHAYSQFTGGTLYSVKAITGTDSDCAAATRGDTTVLGADSVQSFSVGAGRIACIAGTHERDLELLWHAQKDGAASTTMMAKR